MKVSVLLPLNAESSVMLQRSKAYMSGATTHENDAGIGTGPASATPRAPSPTNTTPKNLARTNVILVFVGVQAQASQAMWFVLEPMFFQARRQISSLASLLILEKALFMGSFAVLEDHHRSAIGNDVFSKLIHQSGSGKQSVKSRHLLFRKSATTKYLRESSQLQIVRNHWEDWSNLGLDHYHVCILLQPYSLTRLEYTFASRLISWEHQLIRAQSLTGYVSTLGGGFFLCHHFHTAIWLAQQQQRLAAVLNRPDMYLTCWIHQAYSHIYAGYFRSARAILVAVEKAVSGNNNKYPTLLAMCKSAKLHCKRMKKAALSSTKSISTTIDDFMRIRVVSDKSKNDDVRYPLLQFQSSY